MVDVLTHALIRQHLDTQVFGRHVTYLDECRSTNELARELAESGAPEGSLVVADYQTAGRGRLERRWQAPPGSSLLFSVVFRPRLLPAQLHRLTMLAGMAVADAVREVTGLKVALKWPNDLVLGYAKIGGILAEAGLKGQFVDYAIVGIGLNANLEPESLRGHLLTPVSSLSHALEAPVERLPLLGAIIRGIEQRYDDLARGVDLHTEWSQRLDTLGRIVTVATADRVLSGTAESVDEEGALRLRTADGELVSLMAGDVSLQADEGGAVEPKPASSR